MSDPNWFKKKWGFVSDVPVEELLQKIIVLEEKVARLEEENIETNNILYELSNSLDAVDCRIDILTAEKFLKDDDV